MNSLKKEGHLRLANTRFHEQINWKPLLAFPSHFCYKANIPKNEINIGKNSIFRFIKFSLKSNSKIRFSIFFLHTNFYRCFGGSEMMSSISDLPQHPFLFVLFSFFKNFYLKFGLQKTCIKFIIILTCMKSFEFLCDYIIHLLWVCSFQLWGLV